MKFWFDQEDIQKEMGVSRITLWRWRKKGKVPFLKVGREIFYPASAILRLLKNKGRNNYGV